MTWLLDDAGSSVDFLRFGGLGLGLGLGIWGFGFGIMAAPDWPGCGPLWVYRGYTAFCWEIYRLYMH